MDIIIYISVFILGWIVGNQFLMFKLRRVLIKMAIDHGVDIEEDDEEVVPTFFTELDNGVIFVYNKKNNAFICQGSTLEEVASRCNVRVAKVQHDKNLLVFVNGKVEIVPR